MTLQNDGNVAQAPRTALISGAALALLLLTGCQREADHDARTDNNRAQLPYQLALVPLAYNAAFDELTLAVQRG